MRAFVKLNDTGMQVTRVYPNDGGARRPATYAGNGCRMGAGALSTNSRRSMRFPARFVASLMLLYSNGRQPTAWSGLPMARR